MNLVDLLLRRGDLDRAVDLCTAALRDSPDAAGAHLKLAEIFARRRQYPESLAHCIAARKLAPYIHPPKVVVATYCFANGDAERGAILLREARAESPNHPVPALLLGQLALRQSQWPAARSELSTAESLPMPDTWPESHRKRFLALLHSERFKLEQKRGHSRMPLREALTRCPVSS